MAKQVRLQLAHLFILHRSLAQCIAAEEAAGRAVKLVLDLRDDRRRDLQRQVIQRDGADGIVRAAVAASRVDRQELHKAQPDLRRPVDEFTNTARVADAEIIGSSDGKNGDKDAGAAGLDGGHEGADGWGTTEPISISDSAHHARGVPKAR